MTKQRKLVFCTFLPALFVSLLTGCSLGPRFLRTDYVEYNKSFQESANKEMLLNIVRLRYLEVPFFLQIGAISSTHQYQTTLGGTLSTPDTRLVDRGLVPNFGFSLNNAIGETPTVTFTPLMGAQYVGRILADISLAEFFSLFDTGWNTVTKTLLAVLVEQIGDLQYQINTDDVMGRNISKLEELFELLAQMQMRGDLKIGVMEGEGILLSDRVSAKEVNPGAIITADSAGYYYKPTSNDNYELRKKGGSRYVMMMGYRNAEEANKVESYLGIDLKEKRLGEDGLSRVVELRTGKSFSIENRTKGDIPVLSLGLRSFQQILLDLSAGVDLPPYEPLLNEPATKGQDVVANVLREYMKSVIHVKYSAFEPSNDFVSVSHRGNWFYIDNDDVQSKITFGLLQVLFSLKAAEKQGVIPTLTIPVR